MAPSVKISQKSARALLRYCDDTRRANDQPDRAIAELRAALAPRPKKAFVTAPTRRQTKAKKDRAEKKQGSVIRALVFERSKNLCEACARGGTTVAPLEWDHFWGRARSESVESTWMLCRQCHRDKTNNKPSAIDWLRYFGRHAEEHGYGAEVKRARVMHFKHEAKAELSAGVANG